ncbi:hypothetical protein K449DRAFT_433943 [Hypoxylon sp. EC38]|nr:hypothetical protein K449DRAFT_433943 [Hypoxylon sp. EC38]
MDGLLSGAAENMGNSPRCDIATATNVGCFKKYPFDIALHSLGTKANFDILAGGKPKDY